MKNQEELVEQYFDQRIDQLAGEGIVASKAVLEVQKVVQRRYFAQGSNVKLKLIRNQRHDDNISQSSKEFSDQERLKFLARIQKEKKLLMQKKQYELDKQRKKLQQQLDQDQEFQRLQQEFKLKQIKSHQQYNRQKLQNLKNKRVDIHNHSIPVQVNQPLHEKLENKFQQEYIIPELQKRKDELAKKRDLYKPIDFHRLREHEKQYKEMHQYDQLRLQQKIEQKRLTDQINEASLSFSKSRAYILTENEIKALKLSNQKRIKLRKELIERGKAYGQLASQLYKSSPTRSVIEQRSQSIQRSPQKNRLGYESPTFQLKPIKHKNKPKLEFKDQKVQQTDNSVDYLLKMRIQRKQLGERFNSQAIRQVNFKKIVADKRLDTDRKVEKVDKAISRAQYYEHITNSRELLDKAYIDGIKAKLEILQSMN